MKSFLTFSNCRSYSGKTFVWDVLSGVVRLGEVKWYAPWRRYCFYPDRETLFDRNCLCEVVEFIDEQMKARKIV